jgi:ribosomal protein L11 methyltransferase
VARLVTVTCAAGAGQGRGHDLVFANILARPLMLMARDLARALAPGGAVILAGLLQRQEAAVLAAYRAQGLALAFRVVLDGWSSVVLRKRNGPLLGEAGR